jgi:hypothetical protein
MKLFFQKANSHKRCQRIILLKHTTTLLYRYVSSWIFHLPGYQLTTLRCHTNNISNTSTRIQQGNGIICDASACLLTTDQFQCRHKYWVPHNFLSTLQEYMYRVESPSPRSTKYNSKEQSSQKSSASATLRPDTQRPAELLICTPFSARVQPWTNMNNYPTAT